MKPHRGSRRTSGSSADYRADAGKRQRGGGRDEPLEYLANPPPRIKPEELTAWILTGLATNGRASPVALSAELNKFLTDFELSDAEREKVKKVVLASLNGDTRNGKRNRSRMI